MGRRKKDEEILDENLELELDDTDLDEDEDEEEDEIDEESLKKDPKDIAAHPVVDEDGGKEPQPKVAPRKRAPKAEVAAPAPVVEKAAVSVDPMVAQWDAARKTSEAIAASLEKVGTVLREIPDHYAHSFQKSMKQMPRTSPAARMAFVMSLAALVLSVLSLSFSQSARHAALIREVPVPAAIRQAAAPSAAQEQPAKRRDSEYLAVKRKVKKSRGQ